MSYTIKLDGGKYTVINHHDRLEYLRDGKPVQQGSYVINDAHALAMSRRIEELEVAIKAVLDGTLQMDGRRWPDGMAHKDELLEEPEVAAWQRTLRNVLEQKS